MVEELGLLRSSFTKANITDEQIACILHFPDGRGVPSQR